MADTAYLGHGYAVAGKRDEARRLLDELAAGSARGQYVSPYDVTMIHTRLGNPEQAFAWLHRAVRDHSNRLPYLNVEPRFDPRRGDPRFRALLQHIGF